MLQRFLSFVRQNNIVDTSAVTLLAVSGGIDSVTLCRLFHLARFPFAIAHCNFHLRPNDCDRDEAFVRSLAEQYGVPCFVQQYPTQQYASDNHLSIEEAARRLRYDFFISLVQQHHFSAVATAHHRDDAAETFFLNLLRGTGIAGLHGIRPISSMTDSSSAGQPVSIIRPLLPFGRDEIEHFATEQHLGFVVDSTNASLDYQRNRIRHQLFPLLRQLSPSFDSSMQLTIRNLAEVEQLCANTIGLIRSQCCSASDGEDIIDFSLLPEPRRTVLFELLHPYGFNSVQVDNLLAKPSSGRQFFSATHRLISDRSRLIIVPLLTQSSNSRMHPPHLTFDTIPRTSFDSFKVPPSQALFDADSLHYPLHLRHWRPSDRIFPFGMKGSRLLSDLFSDAKFSLLDKEKQWLLCDADDTVLWVVGIRADGRFAVASNTTSVLQVTINV